jgi:hypothetical protein
LANYRGLLKLYDVRAALLAVDTLERDLSQIPSAFSGQQRPRKGPAPRAWYSGFVRDLAEIAEWMGLPVTTRGRERSATPFTIFVFEVEKFLPPNLRSNSLEACRRQIDRAFAAAPGEIDEAIARTGRRRNPTARRLRDK